MPQLDICQSCFRQLGGRTICPHCGYDLTKAKKYGGSLPPFTFLRNAAKNNNYLVGRVLGKGGFGITYAAAVVVGNQAVRRVAIKEFMPAEYSSRSDGTCTVVPFNDDKSKFVFNHGKEKFVDEARTLEKLTSDPIVVDIIDYFPQNNTAYIVMEYLDGQDLRGMAKASGGKIDPEFAKEVFVTVASSLMEIHKKEILHRDLSPDNIFITKSGQIKLIDFGAARNYVSTQNKGMSILLKPGFAPPEQYNAKGNQGTWSDVYALCATFYNLVSGKPLIDALFRYRGQEQPSLYSLGCAVSKKTSDVIEKGMALEVSDRYKDFMEVLNDIDIEIKPRQSAPKPLQPVSQPVAAVRNIQQIQQPVVQSVPSAGQKTPVQRVSAQPMQSVQTPMQPQNSIYTPQKQVSVQRTVPQPTPQRVPQVANPVPYVAAIIGNTLHQKMYVSTSDILKIGRSRQSCQFAIENDSNISRIHCYIRFDGKTLYLGDNSSNGTYFENGVRLAKGREYPISPGTKFYIATRNHMLVVDVQR